MADESDITLKMIMNHLHSMQAGLHAEMRVLHADLMGEIGKVRSDLMGEIGTVHGRIDRLETNLTRQIDGIDKRLDAIEIENLPKRMRKVEQAVFAGK